jgi:hypothetical protein
VSRLGRALALVLLVATYILPAAWLQARADTPTESGLRLIGTMPFADPETSPYFFPNYPLLVDSVLHIGVRESSLASSVQFFDLATAQPAGSLPLAFSNSTDAQFAVDETHHRMFFTEDPPQSACSGKIHVLDVVVRSWSEKNLPCDGADGKSPLGFAVTGISYYSPTNKLYAIGYGAAEFGFQHTVNGSSVKETTIIRQLDANTMRLDWSIDASSACDWHEVANLLGGGSTSRVQRVGDYLLSFCLQGGPNQNGIGGRGQSLALALDGDRPKLSGNSPVFITHPTYTDSTVTPFIDPVTGRILLTSTQLPFGPGVWSFDPLAGRFYGVIPTGVTASSEDDFYAGTDPVSGRLYFHNSRGFVVADTRHNPLPGGVSYSVLQEAPQLAGPQGQGGYFQTPMFVDGGLHKIFVPDPQRGEYIVIDDLSPPAPDIAPPDPDAGTADIPELDGFTSRAFAGGGTAFGARALLVGGTPNVIHQADLAYDCHVPGGLDGSCVADKAAAPGDRDERLAATDVLLGSSGGSSAFATAGHAAPSDHATDADVRAAGHCYNDQIGQFADAVAPGAYPSDGISGLCSTPEPAAQAEGGTPLEGVTFENMQQGAQQGNDSRGFPIPSSICSDFGGSPQQDSNERPAASVGASAVDCNAANAASLARAEVAGAALPTLGDSPVVSVAHSTSNIVSKLTDEGIVTTVTATAEGISIGGVFSIGRIESVSTTKAHGRSGTTDASYTSTIADVHGPGIDCGTCTSQHVADVINQAFQGRITARVPTPFLVASPRGFTGLARKELLLADSDRAVNDDDSLAIDGLDLIVINDYQAASTNGDVSARSRLLLEFAGVRSESHYGIFPKPQNVAGNGPGLPSALANTGSAGPTVTGAAGAITGHAGSGGPGSSLSGLLSNPVQAFWDAWQLIVNHPGEAAVLACLWTLFAAPLYLRLHRRELARALAGSA